MYVISIITINYNNALGLQNTIKSVLSQSYKEFEYIVIDGASTDNSINIIDEYSHSINYWISEADEGVYDAFNKGIAKALGKYFIFLNSGDCFSDNSVIDIYSQHILNFPEVDIFYGDIYGVSKTKPITWIHKHPDILTLDFLKENNINHQSSMIKAKLFNEFGPYPQEYSLAGDHWFYLICLINKKYFKHINHPLVIYDYSGLSVTKRVLYENEMKLIWEMLVPEDVQRLMCERDKYKLIAERRLVKLILWIDNKVKKIISSN